MANSLPTSTLRAIPRDPVNVEIESYRPSGSETYVEVISCGEGQTTAGKAFINAGTNFSAICVSTTIKPDNYGSHFIPEVVHTAGFPSQLHIAIGDRPL